MGRQIHRCVQIWDLASGCEHGATGNHTEIIIVID
jgi:hypothetical protein